MLFAVAALVLGAAPPAQPRQVLLEITLRHGGDTLTSPTIVPLEGQEGSVDVGQVVDGITYGSRIRIVAKLMEKDGVHVKGQLVQTDKGTPPFAAVLDRTVKSGLKVRMPLGAWKGKEMVLYIKAMEFDPEYLKVVPPAMKYPE
ncbi:MAG: hypothetical protein K2W96_05240 [Gemmataceae bacterium]|nr:hypothetical protein [Gemmataceae bacterium]